MRGHQAIRIEEFNGLWSRGDDESCPLDHFTDCDNLDYFEGGFCTRDGIEEVPVSGELTIYNIVRMYTYVRENVQSLLILDNLGNIYHTDSPTPFTPILSIVGMTDFAFQSVANRAYISPHDGEIGLQGEFLYVYLGLGNAARKAAGLQPTGSTLTAALGTAQPGPNFEAGIHVFGIVYETDTGFLTQIGPDTLATVQATGAHWIDLSGIPVSPDTFVVARHVVVSKSIPIGEYSGIPTDYELFFLSNGRIPNNTQTTLNDLGAFDSELIDSAAALEDLLSEIPASVFLTTYHDRLVAGGFYGVGNVDPSLDESALPSTARLSNVGEPEAFNAVDGLIVAPLDGNSLTNGQEYRDILYLFKAYKTIAASDNGEAPALWDVVVIDQGNGAGVHGITTVLDSGGINIEYIIIANFSGICLFNGTFIDPELTFKIEDYWLALDKDEFDRVQILNDSINKKLYCVIPTFKILLGVYDQGLNSEKIKWCPWSFNDAATTIAFLNINVLHIGFSGVIP